MKPKNIRVFRVLNSRAELTLAVDVDGFWAAAPSGASVGSKEVPAYPQGLDKSEDLFKKAIPFLKKVEISLFKDFVKVEDVISKIAKPSVIGGAVTVALEFALLKWLASEQNKEIYQLLGPKPKKSPLPLGNIIGGGAHAGPGAPDFQEFILCPQTKTFAEAAFINADVHRLFKKILEKGDRTFKGSKTDEGAWVTGLSVVEILDLLYKEKRNAENRYKTKIFLGIDVAASQLFNGDYKLNNYSPKMRNVVLPANRYYNYIADLADRFDVWYVEDPFEEHDAEAFKRMRKEFPDKLVCGDDLTVTNPDILAKVLDSVSAVIVKPNQIGSLVKAKEFVDLAKKKGLSVVVSHRSGDMPDEILAHIALGWGADYFKCGIAGGERVSKANELIRLGF